MKFLYLTSIPFLFLALPVFADELYLEISPSIGLEQEATLQISVQSEFSINAIEGHLELPDILRVKALDDSESAVSLWVERPKFISSTVSFSGVIPGGVSGTIPILEIQVVGEKLGAGMISGRNFSIFLSDGQGTKKILEGKTIEIGVTKFPSDTAAVDEEEDLIPPEPFQPIIYRDKDVFNNKYFLIFSAHDKGSGIASYEVKEGNGKWLKAESPYLLRRQNPNIVIEVKAIDHEGNVRIVKLNNKRNLTAVLLVALVIIVILLSVFLKKERL